jgi:hypothetical protein
MLMLEGGRSFLPKLQVGETVQAKVIRTLPANRVSLEIAGERLWARSYIPLKAGGSLPLRVAKTWPILVLKPVEPEAPAVRPNAGRILAELTANYWPKIVGHIADSGLSPKEQALLRNQLQELTLQINGPPTPEMIRKSIQGSGIFWEAKLRRMLRSVSGGQSGLEKLIASDLKGLLSKLAAREGVKNNDLREMLLGVKDIQLLNQVEVDQSGRLFLPLLLQFGVENPILAQLLLHMPVNREGGSGEKETGDVFGVTFWLELSRLGPLRADVHLRNGAAHTSLAVTTEEIKAVIDGNIHLLLERLEERGIKCGHMGTSVKEAESIRRGLRKEIAVDENKSLDLVV